MDAVKLTLLLIVLAVLIGGVMFLDGCFQKRKKLPYQKTYDFREATLSYQVLGKGKPVILVHGSMCVDPWEGFEKRLAESYQVYLPHLPGFGASDAIEGKLHNSDLFSEAFCAFIKETKLQDAPVIAFSLGTIVAAKAAAQECFEGKLILVGVPGKVSGWRARLAQVIPLFLRRILVTTRWGKEKLLLPALRENIGETDKGRNEEFLADLLTADPRSIVDLDYKEEVEVGLPRCLPQIKNETVFIYGELDRQKDTDPNLVKDYLTIPGAEHNIFRSQPGKSLEVAKSVLREEFFVPAGR